MKVRDLIRALVDFDPDHEVRIAVDLIGVDDYTLAEIHSLRRANDSQTPSPRVEITIEPLLVNAKLSLEKQ